MALKTNPNSERPRKKQGTGTRVTPGKKGEAQKTSSVTPSFLRRYSPKENLVSKKVLISISGVEKN